MKGHTKVSPNIFMISELITLGSFIATTIKKGARAWLPRSSHRFCKVYNISGDCRENNRIVNQKNV